MSISFWGAAGLAVILSGQAMARDLVRPAELPPADYAGQQYVDSKGCLFLRAGTGADVRWIARVTREGGAVCGYPPSGNRVPIAGETGKVDAAAAVDAGGLTAGGLMVAVGSFSEATKADTAAQNISGLGLPVIRRPLVQSGIKLASVFAGPFESEASAEAALRAVRAAGFPDAVIVRP